MVDKRDLVDSIVLRAQVHEERGQINEAISDFETLRSIYPSYQGLKFEIERLQRRREQQSRDAAKANWVRQIDRVREAGNFTRVLELIERAQADFPEDAEFIELQNLARQGFERSKRAEEMLAEGQRLCAEQEFDKGLEVLRQAHELDERNPSILAALHDAHVEWARVRLKTDWRGADTLLANAFALDPESQEGKSVRAQVQAAKRDEEVMQCASQVRRWQTAGDLAKAEAELQRGLALYPSDPRLAAIRDTLQNELTQSNRKKARLREMEQLRGEPQKAGIGTDSGEPPGIAPTLVVNNAAEQVDPDAPTFVGEIPRGAREAETMLATRPAVFPTTPPVSSAPNPASPVPVPVAAGMDARPAAVPGTTPFTAILKSRLAWIGGAVALLLVIGVGVFVWQRDRSAPVSTSATTVVLRIRTSPAGAAISVDGRVLGNSDVTLELEKGEHLVEATLPGYESVSQNVSVGADASPLVELVLTPLSPLLRLVMSGVDVSEVRLDETVSKPEAGSLTIAVPSNGEHLLRFTPAKPPTQEAKIGFTTATGALPIVNLVEAPELYAVAVSSMAAEARVTSSVAGAVVAVDGESKGTVPPEGLLVSNLTPGLHELTIGEGSDLKKMGFTVGPAPSLDAVFFSDRSVGSILVVTKESDVSVIVDGRTNARKTTNGQLRLTNMSIKSYTVRVTKDGFSIPEEQTVEVQKGQEAVLNFELVAVQKPATLQVRQLLTGAQVFVDERSLGTMPPTGTLSAEIPPGSHVVRFALEGYQPKMVTKEFVAGETLVLTGPDVELQRVSATLEVEVEPNATVVVRRDNTQVDQFVGSRKLSLSEGNYVVEGRTSDGRATSQSVRLAAGGAEVVRLTFAADKRMEGFGPKLWEANGTWSRRVGNTRFALYDLAPPGTLSFTFIVPGKSLGIFGSSQVKWVTTFRDERNYILFELDRGGLARTVVIDGRRVELTKIAHKIPWDREFVHISIDIMADKLTHKFKLGEEEWQTLHVWDRNDPELAKRAPVSSFAAGKFGFDGEIQISNFMMRPQP